MRPSRDEILMEHAKLASHRGTCTRLQVGAVVARQGRILVTGYNGTPAGMAHCTHHCDCKGMAISPHGPECFSLKPCWQAVHAEANTVAWSARWGISLEGAGLYCTDTPCVPCAQLIINAGIIEVHYIREYRDDRGLELLSSAGLVVVRH